MRIAPPLSNGEKPPADDVEALLRSYFRAEVPDPWPAPPLVRTHLPENTPAPAGRGPGRSRMALAASVAFLVAGSLAIPGRGPTRPAPAEPLRMSSGEATRIRVTPSIVQPKDKPSELRFDVTEEEARPEK